MYFYSNQFLGVVGLSFSLLLLYVMIFLEFLKQPRYGWLTLIERVLEINYSLQVRRCAFKTLMRRGLRAMMNRFSRKVVYYGQTYPALGLNFQ